MHHLSMIDGYDAHLVNNQIPSGISEGDTHYEPKKGGRKYEKN